MGKFVIKNSKIIINQYDLSSDHNSVELSVTREEKDSTVLGAVGRNRLAGLQSFTFSGSGYFEASTGTGAQASRSKIDTVIQPAVGTSNAEITILPQGSSAGSKGFFSQANIFEYSPGGSVGDILGFSFAGAGEGKAMVQGVVLSSSALTASGTGTPFQLGAVQSHQAMYAQLHVTETSGTSPGLKVTIQSDPTSGFGTPTTRISFTTITSGLASEWKSLATTVSGPWWRTNVTTVGTGERFKAYVIAGQTNLYD